MTHDTEKTFILTDACMWERNKKNSTFFPHSIEVVDEETGGVRYIKSGARIRFVAGEISAGHTQEFYNKHTQS